MAFKKLPGVLSFQRCVLLSDGLFYNAFPNGDKKPLYVMRHGIRGTQNVNRGSEAGQGTARSADRDARNIKITDSAKLADGADLEVDFGFRSIPLALALYSCAPSEIETTDEKNLSFRDAYKLFIEKADKSTDRPIYQLALRYARNIANGRFLWRNRTIAEKINISVTISTKSDELLEFDAFQVPFNDFDSDYIKGEKSIAEAISEGWCNKYSYSSPSIEVKAKLNMGIDGPLEVFPSQNYINYTKEIKNNDKNARSLYCVGRAPEYLSDDNGVRFTGQAALRDQKIGNALRTIDTWYKDYQDKKIPIAIEPKGANLDAQVFFREDNAHSGFELMKRIGDIEPASEEGLFLLACLIRGGVYSEGTESMAKEQKGRKA